MARIARFFWLPVLILAACAGTGSNILHVQAGPGGLSSKNEEINDRSLARSVSFGEVSVRPLGLGSSMEAQIMIQNEGSGIVYFEYRILWYDAAGFELSSVTSWIPAVLSGKEARGFKSTAPGPDAVSFKCMIRKTRVISGTGS